MPSRTSYRYYDLIMAGFVTVLLCANLIGTSKVVTVSGVTFGAGILFFPISYAFGDVLTEVYGYARSRKVVWAGFAAMIFASFMSWVVVSLPPAQGWVGQEAIEKVFESTPRIVIASLIAYACGEFANSFTLAKLKVLTEGRYLWTRTIGSTVIGEAIDSSIFYPIAFYGVWPNSLLVQVTFTNYVFKVLWEVLATPATYKIVAFLKAAENVDHFDRDTDFNPFTLRT